MTDAKLTVLRGNATRCGMKTQDGHGWNGFRNAGLTAAVSALLTGCVNVSAPEDPIVIELNINIRNEVIYRLADDAANTIEDNADIF